MCRYWVADIGGTNCRLADFFRSQEDCRLEGERWIPTSSLSGDADLVAAFEQTFADSRGKIDALAVALAGPVHAGYGALTNGALQLDAGELSSRLGKKALLLNDFAAQAYASVSPLARSARVLREGSQAPDPEGVRGVLGAGTGLGSAALTKDAGEWRVRPGEAGHMPFPFGPDGEEAAYAAYLRKSTSRLPSCEDVLAGRGLEALYAFHTGQACSAAEVGAYALDTLDKPSPTLRLYSRFYGRFCKMWMLATLCTGGLWIGGGIAIAHPHVLTNDDFFSELRSDSRCRWLETVTVSLFSAPNCGLWGACEALHILLGGA